MKIYLATWLEDNQGVTLTKAGANNRLMSYYFINQGKFDIKRYVQTGKAKPDEEVTEDQPKKYYRRRRR